MVKIEENRILGVSHGPRLITDDWAPALPNKL